MLVLASVAALVAWGVRRKNEPPAVPVVKVKRETLVSTLSTNGKVEPFVWAAVRAERAGLVERVLVRDGEKVAAGAVVAAMDDPAAKAEVEGAEARLSEARARLS